MFLASSGIFEQFKSLWISYQLPVLERVERNAKERFPVNNLFFLFFLFFHFFSYSYFVEKSPENNIVSHHPFYHLWALFSDPQPCLAYLEKSEPPLLQLSPLLDHIYLATHSTAFFRDKFRQLRATQFKTYKPPSLDFSQKYHANPSFSDNLFYIFKIKTLEGEKHARMGGCGTESHVYFAFFSRC